MNLDISLGDPVYRDSAPDRKRKLIQNYTAAFGGNFTDWIGKTLPWVRSPEAKFALTDNQRCEQTEDHVGMLLNFAAHCKAVPEKENYEHVAKEVADIRELFRDIQTAGLSGVMLLAVLELTSEIFISKLEEWAISLGCEDLNYTRSHGVADEKHSQALLRALEAELEMGYIDFRFLLTNSTKLAVNLLEQIFTGN